MKFSSITLERFRKASHQGLTSKPSVIGLSGKPENGIFMLIALRCVDGAVEEARFRSFNCISAIAAGDWVCEVAESQPLSFAESLTAQRIDEALGGLPAGRYFCAELTWCALKAALENAKNRGLLI